MLDAISIIIPVPFMTMAKYAEISGMELETVKTWVKRGDLPIKKKKPGSRTTVLINVGALTLESLESKNGRVKL